MRMNPFSYLGLAAASALMARRDDDQLIVIEDRDYDPIPRPQRVAPTPPAPPTLTDHDLARIARAQQKRARKARGR